MERRRTWPNAGEALAMLSRRRSAGVSGQRGFRLSCDRVRVKDMLARGSSRARAMLLICLLAVGMAAAVAGSRATTASAQPPAVRSEELHAKQVLSEIQQINVRLNRASEAWNGARLRLNSTQRAVKATRLDLARTQRQFQQAERRLGRVIVTLYTSDEPSLVDVVLGATSISDLIDRMEVADRVSSSEAGIVQNVADLRERLRDRRERLQKSLRAERALVAELQQRRTAIQSQLDRRQSLLDSIRAEVVQLKAKERARERALAAQARARVAAEQRAHLAQLATARIDLEQAAAPPPTGVQNSEPAHSEEVVPTTSASPTPPLAVTASPTSATPGHPEVVPIALRYLGIPYQWGGASPATGFDCSGFVMYVFAQIGISLPHFAAAQYGMGASVSRALLQPGDLVFFDQLDHVGIYIGAGQFVHAPHTRRRRSSRQPFRPLVRHSLHRGTPDLGSPPQKNSVLADTFPHGARNATSARLCRLCGRWSRLVRGSRPRHGQRAHRRASGRTRAAGSVRGACRRARGARDEKRRARAPEACRRPGERRRRPQGPRRPWSVGSLGDRGSPPPGGCFRMGCC